MSVGVPQQILSGKYRLERELGRGGMGAVWLAQHLTLRSPVAIKLIDPEIAQNPEALSRFLREAQSAASLRSPHVVQILDHGVDNGVPFIVMELLDGESLSARLERIRRLTPADTAKVLTQVARAMTKAHEAGIVHRDLKPDNIFLVRNDEEEIAKVLDFGIAKSQSTGVASVSSATRTGSVLGTPYYMSPEQAEGAKTVDHRTDIWAMGVIACECLVGARPFDAETLGALLLAICARDMPVPSRLGPVPSGFDAWFARACARDLSQRFLSAKEAAHELRAVCAGELMGSYVGPTSGRGAVSASSFASTTGQLGLSSSNAPVKKSPAPWIALGVAALGLAGAGTFVVLRAEDHAEPAAGSASQAVEPARSQTPPAPPPAPPAAVATDVVQPAPPSVPQTAAPAAPLAQPHVAQVRPAPRPRVPAATDKAKPVVATAAAAPAPAPTPAAAAAPAPTPAQTAAKPRVNLGI